MAKITYESVTCGRCGGSGRYPSACWNGVCMGCSGSGFKLTRAGKAAQAKVRAMLDGFTVVKLIDLRPGMRVRNWGGLKNGATVQAVYSSLFDHEHNQRWATVEFRGITMAGNDWDRPVSLVPTPEQFAKAVEYARTLKGATVVEDTPAAAQ